MYVLNYSHADVIQLQAHHEVSVGVTETEELDTGDNDSPDYDELAPTGTETKTKYTATSIDTTATEEGGHEASVHIDPENINLKVDKAESNLSSDKIENLVGGMAVTVTEQKVTVGSEQATEPMVLGQQLAMLMQEFLIECTKIMTPTLMGTMPAVNAPNFAPLISKIQNFLSQKAFTE